MNAIIKVIIIISLLIISARANSGPATPEAIKPLEEESIQTPATARQTMDQLHFALQELKTILADPAHEIPLVKTKTSWIRKYLTSLQKWADEQPTKITQDVVLDDFRAIIDDMAMEVMRDDMLDSNELTTLTTRYINADSLFTQLEQQ